MTTGKHSERGEGLPRPVIKKNRWPVILIWLAPVIAAALVGYYVFDVLHNRGPLVTIRFADATGLKAGESQVAHLGVPLGLVTAIRLSADQKQAVVEVRLRRAAERFARQGAQFWIVRPEISMQEISGLGTILSGPIIDGLPGTGEMQRDFIGLAAPPAPVHEDLNLVVKATALEHLQADSPVYYRGIQVGFVERVELSADSTAADIHVLIERRYSPLVHMNSEFWVVSAVDFKGSIFTGLQMKVEPLRSMLSGGISFATPEKEMGEQAQNGATFTLHEESKKDWLAWSPRIAIEPGPAETQNPPMPMAAATQR